MAGFDPKAWINLEKARILLLDDHGDGSAVIAQIVFGFGVRKFFRCASMEEAKDLVAQTDLHLILVNANLRESPGVDFIDWLRRANLQPNSFTPVILITGHTQRSLIERARDCGANIVMAKPLSPQALLERIVWIAREKRPFVSCGTYVGPDRRFHETVPGPGTPRRRYNDPPEDAADAVVTPSQAGPNGAFGGGEAA